MPAPKGNTYAAKPEADQRTSRVVIPVTAREKARLVREAKSAKLAAYCRRQLGLDPEPPG